MKKFFIVTTVMEAGVGLALLALPARVVSLLLGASLDSAAGFTVARLAGCALLSLGVACWLARNDGQTRAASGLVIAMLVYNTTVAILLAFAGLAQDSFQTILGVVIVLHAIMAGWCVACLRRS
jgi:hypothetical protein